MPAKAGQTALSGSQIKPPALPEVHDFMCVILDTQIKNLGVLESILGSADPFCLKTSAR